MKPKIKMGIDLFMTVLLLSLMAYQITGQELHEWFGTGMLILFLAHNALNIRWYGSIFKGKYTPLRIVQTAINFGILISILCLGFSGIIMSRHVFAALSINGPMATARTMHMAASYWGFVLMGIHIGFHWAVVMGMFRKLTNGKGMPGVLTWLLRLAALIFAGYGGVCFVKADLVSYMFLKSQFVFFDFEKSVVLVVFEYIAMMGMWVFIGCYGAKGIRAVFGKKRGKETGHETD